MPTKQTKLQLVKLPAVILFLFSFFIFFSCKKLDVKEPSSENASVISPNSSPGDCGPTVCEDCAFQEMIAEDTTEYATVLGGTYLNPYSIANMTLAYNSVHGTNIPAVSTTHYYVRFKPQSEGQIDILESLDLELFDYPLDRAVTQDGDYWPEAYANLGQNEYPWLYTVVESNFQFPGGIIYENLASLNIPDDDPVLEDQAYLQTGNLECYNGNPQAKSTATNTTSQGQAKTTVPDCGEGYHWDYTLHECVCDCCPSGYHWDGSTQSCEPDAPPPPTFLHPQGMITFKTYEDYGLIPLYAPLRYTRVVGRRFFKIDKTYTDANGNFQLTKSFPKKVTITVKFRTSYLKVKRNDGWNLKKSIGTYRGNDLQNLNYVFQKSTSTNTDVVSKNKKTKTWLASVTINTVIETKSFLSTNNLTPLENTFRIWMNKTEKRPDGQTLTYEFIKKSSLNGLNTYDVHLGWRTFDINSLTTSKVTINVAQQLGLQYLSKVAGMNRYNDYYSSLMNTWDDAYGYFGAGQVQWWLGGYQPELIAIWQAFAQHLGHTIANQVFGWGEHSFVLQGITWASGGGISSSSKYLEQFNPNVAFSNDPLKWIPAGLINDLMDTNNESSPVNDNVSGFTYGEIQAAYSSGPSTMLAFKNALKAIKPSQATAIDQLFASYNY
jgi:hypothetical protein